MIEFRLNRRQIISSCFSGSFFLVILSSCFPVEIITIARIISSVRAVQALLALSQQSSNNTVYSMNVSYKELSKYLRDKNFSPETVQKMERRHASLSTNSMQLRSQLSQTSSAANQLFSMLETRANQNSTSELKEKMISDIREKKNVFEQKMKVAEQVVSKVEESVKKYDDILGYIQVGTGINQIDKYINDVDTVIVQAKNLDNDIKNALNQSQSIVASFETAR